MKQVPDSLLAFQHMFPDDDACAAWLIEMRWPDGFVCPACGHEKGWALRRKAHTFECAGCRRQTSVTAGTILHASKLPLICPPTCPTPTASLPCSETARAQRLAARPGGRPRAQPVVGPGGNRWTKDDPPTGGQGRSHDGKMLRRHRTRGRKHRRLRLAEISSYASDTAARPPGHRENTAGPASMSRRSTMSMSSGRPPLTSSCRGSTKSSPTSKDGRDLGCVASICRPISMSSLSLQPPQNPPRCFPLALPPRHQCRTPYLQHVDRTGAMCISGSWRNPPC